MINNYNGDYTYMAENRTLQFMGLGYGNTAISITASINGQQFFSGEVQTVDQPLLPYTYDQSSQTILLTLPDSAGLNTDFSGNVPMSITATGDTNAYGVWFGVINSNYSASGNTRGTVDTYDQCYYGAPTNSDNTTDSRSNVAITGQEIPTPRPPGGVANWCVPVGQTLTYNLNIAIGRVGNITGNIANYTGPYTPMPMATQPA